jgi:16S rRNA (cytidine1402-2'-O)-methyltransferase
MALQIIATPIGHLGDITLRAIEALKEADIVIGEERREVSTLLKRLGIEGKHLELLNEHTKDEEVAGFVDLCLNSKVALVSDCGTPGFCDPGARLVAACRQRKITVTPLPGASSLMCLISLIGHNLTEFVFRGFLPAEKEARALAIDELKNESRAVIVMDTPYRLAKLLPELAQAMPDRPALLGCDFTQDSEACFEGKLKDLPALVGDRKAEFIMALLPTNGPRNSSRAPNKGPTVAPRPVKTRSFESAHKNRTRRHERSRQPNK